MDDITIYTTIYPIEYITNELYGENSDVYSIYPNEVIELTDKLIKDYSNADMFVYNGSNTTEINYAVKMVNLNKNLLPVIATGYIQNEIKNEELWLNPSNFLSLCSGIRDGIKELIKNTVLRKKIDTNYEKLQLEISELDAEIKLLIENADDNNILVSNDALKFLEKKYNDPNSREKKINVVSVDNNEDLTNDTINEAKKLIEADKIKYIIMFKDDVLTDEIEKIITDNNIEKLYFESLTTLSSENKAAGKDYISIMRENLNILGQELYEEQK